MGSGQHEIVVHDEVVILGITRERDAVLVDVFGGPDNVCGCVRVSGASRRMVQTLRSWARGGTPLRVEHAGGTVTFQPA